MTGTRREYIQNLSLWWNPPDKMIYISVGIDRKNSPFPDPKNTLITNNEEGLLWARSMKSLDNFHINIRLNGN